MKNNGRIQNGWPYGTKRFVFNSSFVFLNLEFVVMKRFKAFEVKKIYKSCQLFLNAFLVIKICKHA